MKRLLDLRPRVGSAARRGHTAGPGRRAPTRAALLVGLLASVLAILVGLWAVPPTLAPGPFASSGRVAGEQACIGHVSIDAQSCELLLVVHLLPADRERRGRALAEVEALLGQVEAAIARVPGVVRIVTYGGAGEAASRRSLLNDEPTLAIAVFRARGAEAGSVASAVRGALTRLGRALEQDPERHGFVRLRWAVAYDTTRFPEPSFAARIESSFEALLRGVGPTREPRYLVASVRLPDGTSPDRADALLRQVSEIAFTHPAIESTMAFAGASDDGSIDSADAGLVYLTLRPGAGRRNSEWSADAIAAALNDRFSRIDAAVATVLPPSISRSHRSGPGRAGSGAPTLAAVFASPGDDEPSLFANVGPAQPVP